MSPSGNSPGTLDDPGISSGEILSDEELCSNIQKKIDAKTKPPGSLGKLESLALRIALRQKTAEPTFKRPTILVFAADHGATAHGISAFPQEVTRQMVLNFLRGGAAINVFARQSGMELRIIDSGIAGPPIEHNGLIRLPAGEGTADYVIQDAITSEQLEFCKNSAATVIEGLERSGCNLVGFGEMGIGNTSSASLILHFLGNVSLEECVGAGTGLDLNEQNHKLNVLQKARDRKPSITEPEEVLRSFGGFEIAQMYAAMKIGHEKGMLLLIDGFISSAAFLVAYCENPEVLSSAVFCHRSKEKGHQKLLEIFQAEPVLDLEMRLGEGTGCALAFPILRSSIAFLNEMASFESAGVTGSG
ncbi:MAG: nicotinate-nucleotide--dimethylbenzimidazole phosphoribosyltransferase [Leptospiraceae bacterium]